MFSASLHHFYFIVVLRNLIAKSYIILFMIRFAQEKIMQKISCTFAPITLIRNSRDKHNNNLDFKIVKINKEKNRISFLEELKSRLL